MIKKYLNPQNDVAFKRIFGQDKNKDILLAMLNAVLHGQLHTPIQEVTFLSPIQDPEIAAKKQSIVDVLCEDQDGCQYIIEMQVANTTGFEARAQYYASKAFIRQAEKGGLYEELKQVIFLAFCNFPISQEEEDYKSEHIILNKKTYRRKLDKFSFTFIDLIKFERQRTKTVAELSLEEKFYYFLRHAEDITPQELERLIGEDKVIKKAFFELERYSWSENDFRLYEKEEKRVKDNEAALRFAQLTGEKKGIQKGRKEGIQKGRKEGIQEGRKEGIQEGRKEGKKEREMEIAKQMHAEGMAHALIAKVTGLSEKEILALF